MTLSFSEALSISYFQFHFGLNKTATKGSNLLGVFLLLGILILLSEVESEVTVLAQTRFFT